MACRDAVFPMIIYSFTYFRLWTPVIYCLWKKVPDYKSTDCHIPRSLAHYHNRRRFFKPLSTLRPADPNPYLPNVSRVCFCLSLQLRSHNMVEWSRWDAARNKRNCALVSSAVFKSDCRFRLHARWLMKQDLHLLHDRAHANYARLQGRS